MKRLLVVSVALIPAWAAASAQDQGQNRDYRVRVGLGAQVKPEFIGSDHHDLGPYLKLDIARGSDPFKVGAPDDHLGITLIRRGGFSVGPNANIEDSRKDKDVGVPLGKVKTTFEAGLFAQYMAKDDTFRVRGELRKGLGGHDGLVGSFGVDKIWRDGDKYAFTIGPRILFSDSRYQRAYFGVTPAQSLATGLPIYRPNGGIRGIAAASGLSYQFSPAFGLFGYGRYERLVGDAAKSPIVRQLGSRNQFSAGIGLSYTFNVNR